MLAMDYGTLVSRADFVYREALPLGEDGLPATADGLPIGNGRMAGIVRGTPDGLYVQLNRADVMGANSCTGLSLGQLLCHGCGQVLIELGGQPLAGEDVRQELRLHDALGTIAGGGVTVRVFALPSLDVLVCEVTDRRAAPAPLRAGLRMLRAPEVV